MYTHGFRNSIWIMLFTNILNGKILANFYREKLATELE